ncbi:2407_t:CDS:2, partial [Racocetra fulgida]
NHCKNVSRTLVERVTNANNYVKELELCKDENSEFLAKSGTFQKFNELRNIVAQIVSFVERISRIEGLATFKSTNEIKQQIKQQFCELVEKFDKYSEELKFASKNSNDNFALEHDLAEIDKISQTIPLIVQLTEEFNKQLLNDKIKIIRPLSKTQSLDSLKVETFELIGYKMSSDEIRGQHIRKWSKISDPNKVIAVKEVNIGEHPDISSIEQIKKQIEILKMLQ